MKKTFKILSFILVIFFLSFTTAEARTLAEIRTELNSVALVLTGLSNDSNTRKNQLQLVGEELSIIAKELKSYKSGGKVLGASSSSSSSSSRFSGKRPVAEVEINPGTRNQDRVVAGGGHRDILSFKVEPLFSDIWVKQVEITFDREVSKYLEEISLVSGNKVLYTLKDLDDDDFSEIGDGDAYAFRFSGLLTEVREGGNKTFKVRVKARDSRSYDGINVTAYLRNGAIRFTDEVDFTQSVPYDSSGDRGRFSNEFEVVQK